MTPLDNLVIKAGLLFSLALGAVGAAQAQAEPQEKTQAPGSIQGLSTQTESSVGVSLIGYKYEEPGFMALKARKLGIEYSGTYAFAPQWPSAGQSWFVRGEFQYAVGNADYSSPRSGTLNGTENYYYEIRGQLGRDFQMKGYVLAPYVGLGFRHLYNDLRGFRLGYGRENDLQTASVGFTHRIQLRGGAKLSTNFEYMHLLTGLQRTKGYPVGEDVLNKQTIENKQNNGYGLRLSSMWRSDRWSFGPSLTYWSIKDSEAVRVITTDGRVVSLAEPKNTTTEIGFKTSYHF